MRKKKRNLVGLVRQKANKLSSKIFHGENLTFNSGEIHKKIVMLINGSTDEIPL